jgi:hypothetical protein
MQVACVEDQEGCLRMGGLPLGPPYAKAFNKEWSVLLTI